MGRAVRRKAKCPLTGLNCSGNPNDPNYQNLTKLWLSGQYFPLLYTKAAVQKGRLHADSAPNVSR